MKQGIPLEVTYMNHAYETLRWELAPVLAAYAAAETERLGIELNRIQLIAESHASTIGALGLNMQSLVAERDRLRKALEKYGEHEEACDYHADAIEKFCTCGLRAALQDSASSQEGE